MSVPVLTPATATVNGTAGTPLSAFSFAVHATGTLTVTFGSNGSGVNVPGITLDDDYLSPNRTYTFTGTPSAQGTFVVPITATNGDGSAQGTYTFVISDGTINNTAVNDATASTTVGQPFSFTATANKPIAHWFISPLPAGLAYNATTGQISGTPTAAGVYAVGLSAQKADGNGGWEIISAGTLTLTVVAVPTNPEPVVLDSHIGLEFDLQTSQLKVANGAPIAWFGEQKILRIAFVPAANAAAPNVVTGVTWTLKEKSQVPQYRALLAGAATADGNGGKFITPAITFGGDPLRDSLTLYDEVEPSAQVVYSLEVFGTWGGRTRKSSILDFTVLRPLDMDSAQEAVITPGPVTPGGGASISAVGQAPNISGLTGGQNRLDGLVTLPLPTNYLLQIYEEGRGITTWRLEAAVSDLGGDPRVVEPLDFAPSNNARRWVARA